MNGLGVLSVLAYSGGGWVIYLLLGCSVLTAAVVIERLIVQAREHKALRALKKQAVPLLEAGDLAGSAKSIPDGAASRVRLAGLGSLEAGAPVVEERMTAARILEKQYLERRLLILGSLGNNAPFIGLFGTVLGVIKAFHDLAETAAAGPEVVMAGLSEALIATAVGLLVAIPAVMTYNYLQKRVNDLLAETDALSRLLLAQVKKG